MGKKEEKQLLELVGTGAAAGDKDKLLRLLYPKQRLSHVTSALEREEVKNLREKIDVSNVLDIDPVRAECGSTPLILACLNGHTDLAILLIQHGANVNKQDLTGNTALHWAAFHDRQDLVDVLFKANINPNVGNNDGETPLHFIVKKMQVGQLLTMVRMLQGGAKASLKNSAGDTPLTVAARLNKIDAVSLLYDSCHELSHDVRPLIEACRTGRLELSEILLDCGFDPNGIHPSLGTRPLHEAVQFCRPKICRLLIQFGADSMMKDNQGNTAESLARMLPGHRGPEYLRIFEKGRQCEARTPRVEKERVSKIMKLQETEVTESLPKITMFTQWTRNTRPYRSRSDPVHVVFNLFDDDIRTRYIIPRGRNNWILFDFGSKFLVNGVQVTSWDHKESLKNFELHYAHSIKGPWNLARAFRARRIREAQLFRGFVAVAQYMKLVIVDNYQDDISSRTSFRGLAFYGLDPEFKSFFGNIGLAKFDQSFMDSGYNTIPSILHLNHQQVERAAPTASAPQVLTIVKGLEHLRKTYKYSKNVNMWWKTQPVCKCSAGQPLPPFTVFVDSGVSQEFELIVKGGATLSGETKKMSICDPEDRSKPGKLSFSNISLQPPGVYLLVVTDGTHSLYSYRPITVGDTKALVDVDNIYSEMTARLSFTQVV